MKDSMQKYIAWIEKAVLRLLLRPNVISALTDAIFFYPKIFGDKSRLLIAKTATVNNALFNLKSGYIKIEDNVFFGHNVSLLTGTHDIYQFENGRRLGIPSDGRDIMIMKGAWIASNVMIIGPCKIGEHAVVCAGAVVTRDVPAYTVVAGVPARIIKQIPKESCDV